MCINVQTRFERVFKCNDLKKSPLFLISFFQELGFVFVREACFMIQKVMQKQKKRYLHENNGTCGDSIATSYLFGYGMITKLGLRSHTIFVNDHYL